MLKSQGVWNMANSSTNPTCNSKLSSPNRTSSKQESTNSFGKQLTNVSRPLQGLLGDACQPKAWPFCRKCDNCAASCEFGKHKTTTARLTIASTTRLQVSGLPACLRKLCVYSVYNPCIYIFNISIRDHSWSCVLVTINLSASLSISPQNVYLKIDQHCSSLLHASRCRDQHFYQNQAVVQVECGISIFYIYGKMRWWRTAWPCPPCYV